MNASEIVATLSFPAAFGEGRSSTSANSPETPKMSV